MKRRLQIWILFCLQTGLLCCLRSAAQTPTPQWRPVYHFTPEENWTNDPNGLLFLQGVYHLYNQQNPFGNEWGHMSWGHSTSTDLVHWKHLPIAIPETVGWDTTWRFSGCAVFDAHNTSGFCRGDRGCIVAIYTADQPNRHLETQYVAYSNDGGLTFTNYSGNPVLDLHLKDFRDPNVSWNEGLGQWLMAVSMVDQHKVRFYASPDLKNWTLLSEFGPLGFAGAIWECPAFFPLPVRDRPGLQKWVLMISSPGPHGGPYIQYFVGDFDGKEFHCSQAPGTYRTVDYGNTFYAAIAWNGLPAGKRTYIGWIMPEARPTYPWRGAMSIPRDLSLRETPEGLALFQEPARLIKSTLPSLSKSKLEKTSLQVSGEQSLGNAGEWAGNAYWIEADIHPGSATRTGFRIAANAVTGEKTEIGYDRALNAVYVDRTHSDTTGLAPEKLFQVIPAELSGGALHLEILLDKSTLEVFVNHGAGALTTLIFPGRGAGNLSVFATGNGATLEKLTVWNMEVRQ